MEPIAITTSAVSINSTGAPRSSGWSDEASCVSGDIGNAVGDGIVAGETIGVSIDGAA